MLTYTGRRNLYGTLTNDSSSANLTIGDTLMNLEEAQIVAMRAWPFLADSSTFSTVSSQQFYDIPAAAERVTTVTVTVGGTTYSPILITSRQEWDRLNSGVSLSSDVPERMIIYGGTIGFWPIPASSTTDAVTVYYRKGHIDLSLADYTTGTITTLAAAGTAVTGSGTTWAAGMVGHYLKITPTAAALGGDGRWYKVTAVGSTTTLTLDKPYGGVAIAAGSATYTLGQVGLLPEAYQKIPVYRAVQQYFTTTQPEPAMADRYMNMADTALESMRSAYASNSDNPVLYDPLSPPILNPNNYPRSIG